MHPLRQRVKFLLSRKVPVRWHMSLMLAVVVLGGVLASRAMLALGVTSPLIRYVVAVMIGYAMFFGCVRLWLAYGWRGPHDESTDPGLDLLNFPGHPGSPPSFYAAGGRFGGGGASADFDGPASGDAVETGGSASSHASGAGDLLGGADEGCLIVLALGAFLFVLGGASVYVVYAAPAILGDALLQFLLASSLVRAQRHIDRVHWVRSVLGDTLWPFLAVLLFAAALGWVIWLRCPAAATLLEALRFCTRG